MNDNRSTVNAFADDAQGSPRARPALAPSSGLAAGIIGYLVAVFVSVFVMVLVASAAPDAVTGVAGVVASSVSLWVGFAGASVYVARRYWPAESLSAAVGLRQRWFDVPAGLALGAVTQAVIVPALYWLLFRLVGDQDVGAPARALLERGDGVGTAVLVVVVGFGAPIVEEIFFRGVLQRSAVARFGPRIGVVLIAVLFAATHLQPLQFPGLLVIGLVLGCLTQRFGRLGPAIWTHIGFNLTTVVILSVTA